MVCGLVGIHIRYSTLTTLNVLAFSRIHMAFQMGSELHIGGRNMHACMHVTYTQDFV